MDTIKLEPRLGSERGAISNQPVVLSIPKEARIYEVLSEQGWIRIVGPNVFSYLLFFDLMAFSIEVKGVKADLQSMQKS